MFGTVHLPKPNNHFEKWTQSRFNPYTYYYILIKGEKKEKHFSPVKENIDIMQYL